MIEAGRRIVYGAAGLSPLGDGGRVRVMTARGSSSMMAVFVILLVASSVLNLYLWSFRYSEGVETGFAEGSAAGYLRGYEEGNSSGYASGRERGYDLGFSTGRGEGLDIGFREGNETGYVYGYSQGRGDGYDEGYDVGFESGNETGVEAGYVSGYDAGYLQGVEDGAGRGYSLRDPTYKEARLFIRRDETDTMIYDAEGFVCHDFSAMFKTNAFRAGYKCFYVYIKFPDSAHAIVGFNTTDRGLIFVEPQSDDIVTLEIGIPYWDRSKYQTPDFDDTVVDFDLIP